MFSMMPKSWRLAQWNLQETCTKMLRNSSERFCYSMVKIAFLNNALSEVIELEATQ